MDIEHPGAKMIVEVAKTQDAEVGDGTTTAAVLAGEFLTKAEDLLESGVHPTVIANGYRLAADQAAKIIDTITISASPEDTETLVKLATTAITGKGAETHKDHLSRLAVKAVKSVVEKNEDGKITVDIEDVKVEKRPGGSIRDSEIIDGVIIDKERVHPAMPERVENAKILLLSVPIELKKTETKAEIKITTPDQMQLFLDQEEAMLREIVDKVINTGANVVFCQKGIDDLAQYYMTKAGIFGMRRIKKSDIEKIARATGARIITNLDEIEESDLGCAGLVEEKDVTGSRMTFVTGCQESKTTSILLRGGTEHVVEGLERALEDALRVVGVALEDQKIVAGGGSPEVELSLRLKEYAATLKGREQLAVMKFAESLEIIPHTLAENAGLDPIDMLVEMRSQHEKGNKRAGLNVYTGKIEDMFENNVLEPLRIKTQAINAATEAAIMILRIDDVIASSSAGGRAGPGMGPGAGGEMPEEL
jgi:thermosome